MPLSEPIIRADSSGRQAQLAARRFCAWHSAMASASDTSDSGRLADGQQHLHHVRDLRLVGRAGAHHGELDGSRRIFVHRSALCHRRAQRSTARLPQLQRAVGIAMHEHSLDGDLIGLVLRHQRQHLLVDVAQPAGEISAGCADAATGHMRFATRPAIDHAKARAQRARIQPQHALGQVPPARSM